MLVLQFRWCCWLLIVVSGKVTTSRCGLASMHPCFLFFRERRAGHVRTLAKSLSLSPPIRSMARCASTLAVQRHKHDLACLAKQVLSGCEVSNESCDAVGGESTQNAGGPSQNGCCLRCSAVSPCGPGSHCLQMSRCWISTIGRRGLSMMVCHIRSPSVNVLAQRSGSASIYADVRPAMILLTNTICSIGAGLSLGIGHVMSGVQTV